MALALTVAPSALGDIVHTIVITSDPEDPQTPLGGVSDTLTFDGGIPMNLIEPNDAVERLSFEIPNEYWLNPVSIWLLDPGECCDIITSDVLVLYNTANSAGVIYCSDGEPPNNPAYMGLGCFSSPHQVAVFDAQGQFTLTASTAVVPEPSTLTLTGTGTVALILMLALIRPCP